MKIKEIKVMRQLLLMTRMKDLVKLLDMKENVRSNLREMKSKERRKKVTRTDKYGRR
jgi:hypothetical protein